MKGNISSLFRKFAFGKSALGKFSLQSLRLKRIDSFILSKFLQLFAAAFFVCLFVFMMQFTWRYVDDLVGKGLTLDVLARFFWYMGLTLVPQALPLAFLLASLITFGRAAITMKKSCCTAVIKML